MTPVRALRGVLADVAALAPRGDTTWFLLLAAVVLQAAFWYLATPGPSVLGGAGREPLSAFSTVAWTAVTLLLVPMLLLRWVGVRPAEAGLRVGDARFGLSAVAALALVAVPLLVLASGDASLQAAYPWAGAWPGERWATLATWAAVYALYYVSFEFFYRGFVLNLVGAPWGAAAAMWLQVVMATLVHLGKPLPEMIAAAPASLVFGVIAVRSRSVLYPALLHWIIGLTLDVAVLARQGHLLS
ncbi:MAG: CPBP family intramembrane glutamic endopeptidase [Trueperaceae bacterium]